MKSLINMVVTSGKKKIYVNILIHQLKEELNLNQEEGLQKYMQKKFVLLVQHLIA